MKSLPLGFFLCFWSAITLVFDGFIAYNGYHQVRSLRYPSVPGVITHSEVSESSGEDGSTYGVDLKYDYTVGNDACHGNRYHYGDMSSSGSFADEIVASLPVGARVDVFYNPDVPSDSVLKTGMLGMDLFLPLFMMPFNMVMLGGWGYAIHVWLNRKTESPAGGMPVLYEGGRTHLQLQEVSPLGAAAATAGIVAFVGIFIVGFGWNMNPSMAVIGAAWAIVFGLSAFAYVRTLLSRNSGKQDLIINESGRWISFPQSFGRKGELIVDFDSIDLIEVEAAPSTNSDDNSTDYIPTIVFTTADGNAQREKLAKWKDRERAESLAQWLRENIPLQS